MLWAKNSPDVTKTEHIFLLAHIWNVGFIFSLKGEVFLFFEKQIKTVNYTAYIWFQVYRSPWYEVLKSNQGENNSLKSALIYKKRV